ncbi:anti-sigma factor family protein [Cohnella silvisoli]|uniref:Zf-HC2 domain-containing protein n=1 Tax=Cohnella silvisoli TaxID=2873699 RepID=A0ABV1KN68_9BACL|nr:zf-HC2 domain-containing protein [Cohnella silvisoli]MCD9021182.1 zf-HC2 domain-containing protein [Cohnella silvisoli]
MKCEEAGEWFGIYQDLPEDSAERIAVDLHVQECSECAEEFSMWEESALLIQELPMNDEQQEEPIASEWVNQNVMSRIYAEQSWYMPTVRRTYSFSFAFRRKVAGILAALLALFVCGFLYTAFGHVRGVNGDGTGVMDTANVFATSQQVGDSVHLEVPVASLSDPIMLNVTPAMPEYWVALSMLGMIMTLLILNWFSRVRT